MTKKEHETERKINGYKRTVSNEGRSLKMKDISQYS